MNKIRIIIVDDHPVYREGLRQLIEKEQDMEVIAVASDGKEALGIVKDSKPDVAIVDVAMPIMNGIDTTKEIKSVSPTTAVLVLSAFEYESYILGSLRAGASGYLLKNVSLSYLISSIRLLHDGEAVFDRNAYREILGLVSHEEDEVHKSLEQLHPREKQIIHLAGVGMSNKAIAARLGISKYTVQTHFRNIFTRLGANSRTEAVILAMKGGMLNIEDLKGFGDSVHTSL